MSSELGLGRARPGGAPERPSRPARRRDLRLIAGAWALALLVLAAIATGTLDESGFRLVVSLLAAVALVYLAWQIDPAWSISVGLIFSVFSSNWAEIGVPIGPDRVLLLTGAAAALVNSWRDIRWTLVHSLLAILGLWALVSAVRAGTVTNVEDAISWFDRVGVMPILALTIAPIVFRTKRQRDVLLGAGVALGAYLGATAFFETVGLDALVFPKYILDPDVGIHLDRARGPFAQAVGNGLAMFGCAAIAGIALFTWRRRWPRLAALGVIALCGMGIVFTVTRSVWIAAAVGTIVTLATFPELRRFLAPAIAGGVVIVLAVLAFVPGLASQAGERGAAERPVWDRLNLNAAAIDMIDARPLLGFGWSTFGSASPPFFDQADTYPLTAVGTTFHNTVLGYGAEIGLVGVALWVLAIFAGVAMAVIPRPPPSLRLWRAGLLGYAVAFVIVANFVNLAYPFCITLLWLWIGMMLGTSGREDERPARSTRDAPQEGAVTPATPA